MDTNVKSFLVALTSSIMLTAVVACNSSDMAPESAIALKAGKVVTFSENEAGGIKNGWWEAESAGNWSKSDRPILILSYDDAFKNGINLIISMGAFVIEANPKVSVLIKANEEAVKDIEFSTEKTFQEVSLNISQDILSRGKGIVTLTFEISGAAVPKELGWSIDERKLGILLTQLIAKPLT